MEKITQLVNGLSKREISSIRKFFKLTRSGEQSSKKILFELLVSQKKISDEIFQKKFNRKPNNPAFIMLKTRLMEDILKVLAWEEKAKEFSSKFHAAKYRVRKLILEASILSGRGLAAQSEGLLIKANRLAKIYELTNESIMINDELQTLIGLKQGLATYKKYADTNLDNFELIKDEFLAQDYFRKLTMPNLFFVGKAVNYKAKSEEATKQLKELSDKGNSIHAKYWYLRSEVYYNHLLNDYEKANHSAKMFFDLVSQSSIFNSRDNLGGANMQLSVINIYLYQFQEAVKYAKDAMENFLPGSLNQASALDCMFTAYFLNQDLKKSRELIKVASEVNSIQKHQKFSARWTYFEANLLFMEGKFADALAILQKQSELLSDKSGWRIGYKILEMMCIIEMNELDWLQFRIETYRKLLSELKKENIARPKLIYQLIKNFIKCGYDFSLATANTFEHLVLLRSHEIEYSWDPRGFEMVRFDVWWDQKLVTKN